MSLSNIQPVTDEMTRRWVAYVEARGIAERSDHIQDGIAAGMAWKAFLDLFLDDHHFNKMPGGSPMTGV
ncbi:hypothetical protein QMT40_001806 [Parvibaculaceae bacterium PLY_AMNH_Bact1]|nr:hypothetical protein QMT40_001806 [Parvibaculaceae bacterium PLY_AMNH_Bact1]